MDIFGKAPKPSSSGEPNENDVSHNPMGSNSKSQKPKKSEIKHFMSPTISAKSKVAFPRKKILAEKNESLTSPENAHIQKSAIVDSRSGLRHRYDQISTLAVSDCGYNSESDDDKLSTFSADSSLKPYDPLTNYLSPRPKYLRFKPNRRHEILLPGVFGGVKKAGSFLQTNGILNSSNQKFVDEENSSELDQEPLSSSPQEGSSEVSNSQNRISDSGENSSEFDQEEPLTTSPQEGSSDTLMVKAEDENDYGDEHTDDEDEEGEEFEGGKGRCFLKGLLKFLLLLVVIAVSTSYISTMNGPTPSPVVEAIGGLRDCFHKIQNRHLFEAVSTNLQSGAWVNGSGVRTGDAQTGYLEVNKPFGNEIVQMIDPYDELIENICDDGELYVDLNWAEWESAENKHTDRGKEASNQLPGWEYAEADAAIDKELMKVEDSSERQHQCAALDDIQSAYEIKQDNQISEGSQFKNDHKTDEFEGGIWEKKGEEMTWIGPGRAADTIRSMEGELIHMAEEVGGISVEQSEENLETDWQTSETELIHMAEEVGGISAEQSEENLETDWQTSETADICVNDKIFVPAVIDSDYTELDDPNRIEKEAKKVLGPISMAASIWCFSLLSIILASAVYIYFAKALQAPVPDSHPEVSHRKEKLNLAQPLVEFEHCQKKAESIAKPSSACFSFEETTKEFTHIHSPDVKLLGEFLIGEQSSSSLRSCGRKGIVIEAEESFHPISLVVGHAESRAQPVAAQAKSLNISNIDSPSYGSFTAETMIRRKEQGVRDGDAKKLVTTPVRRSSRIRNLTLTTSP